MKTTNRLLALIAFLLTLHLLKDVGPVTAVDKVVVHSIDKPVSVRIVAVDRRMGAEWDRIATYSPMRDGE